MVRIIIIARKTDGLIFCENSEESTENNKLKAITIKSKQLLTNMSMNNNDCSLNVDSEDYSIQ